MTNASGISSRHFNVLRRIAWGYNASIEDTLHKVIEDWVSQNDTRFICEFCKNRTFCSLCFVNNTERNR